MEKRFEKAKERKIYFLFENVLMANNYLMDYVKLKDISLMNSS